jgi:hypothetical protein
VLLWGPATRPDRSEQLWRALAPAITAVAATLAVACLLAALVMTRSLPRITAVDVHAAGWLVLSACCCVAAFTGGVLASDHIGPGPFLAIGATVGGVGIWLGQGTIGPRELVVAVVACGTGAGALLGGVATLPADLPRPWSRAVTVSWAVSLVAVWPAWGQLALRAGSGTLRVEVGVPFWLLATAVGAIAMWSVLAMTAEPEVGPTPSSAEWRRPLAGLLSFVTAALVVATVMAFDVPLPLPWLRPVVVVLTAGCVAAVAVVLSRLPDPRWRLSLVAVTAVLPLVPVTLLLTAGTTGRHQAGASWLVVVLAAVAVAGCCSAAARWVTPIMAIPVGLALSAVAAVAVWVVQPGSIWVLPGATLLAAAAGAVVAAGLLNLPPGAPAIPLIISAGLCALVLGLVLAVPLCWAMLGDVPARASDLQASGRLYAGLTVAGSSLSTAYTWNLRGRLQTGQPAAPGRAPGAPGPQTPQRG